MSHIDIDWGFFEDAGSKVVEQLCDQAKEDAIRDCPKGKTGNLARSIEKHHNPGDSTGFISVGGETADYWADVEYGTNPHDIEPKNKKALSDGTNVYGKKVHHPGTKPQPFMRPSLYKNRTIQNLD